MWKKTIQTSAGTHRGLRIHQGIVLSLVLNVGVFSASTMAYAQSIKNPFPNRTKAVELSGGTQWLNTSGEITLEDLRGKVVLLDFWTYCCINCMHVLPDLKILETKYANQLVVIGVHSAKFDNEKDSENIRRAIVRYEIEHPVVNDSSMTIWGKFNVHSWPTLVLIDPEGYYCGYVSGEGQREAIDGAITRLIRYHKAKGTLDETPIRFDLERHKQAPTPLTFPGKVLADASSDRLFVSDSNHNRIVISTLNGQLLDVVGSGVIGRKDGAFDEASFHHPQGMELVGNTLYIADTENHLLRIVDLKQRTVKTLAGTGKQARFRASGGGLRQSALNSPWALRLVDGTLFVAMAGPHQIWAHKLGSKSIRPFAGSGREDIRDGRLSEAALAQPSGIATDGQFLYVADSEGSAIRKIGITSNAQVATVVGTSNLPNGRSLFAFGDRDGVGAEARLQHPLGVAYHEGSLYVADSYNHKIKKVDLKTQAAETWLGTGKRGAELDPVQFSEPSGLSIASGSLYIADTNNHRVCVVDLKTKAVSELTIQELVPPMPAEPDESLASSPKALKVPRQEIASGDSLTFEVELSLPEGYKLNKLASVTYRLTARGAQDLIGAEHLDVRSKASANGSIVRITVPREKPLGRATIELEVTYVYCRDGVGGLCKLNTQRWLIPVEATQEATQTVVNLKTSG